MKWFDSNYLPKVDLGREEVGTNCCHLERKKLMALKYLVSYLHLLHFQNVCCQVFFIFFSELGEGKRWGLNSKRCDTSLICGYFVGISNMILRYVCILPCDMLWESIRMLFNSSLTRLLLSWGSSLINRIH